MLRSKDKTNLIFYANALKKGWELLYQSLGLGFGSDYRYIYSDAIQIKGSVCH